MIIKIISNRAYHILAGYDRTHQQRDHTDIGYTPNVLPTNPKRQRHPRDPYTPGS